MAQSGSSQAPAGADQPDQAEELARAHGGDAVTGGKAKGPLPASAGQGAGRARQQLSRRGPVRCKAWRPIELADGDQLLAPPAR